MRIGLRLIKYAKYSDEGGSVSYSGGRSMGVAKSADLNIDIADEPVFGDDVLSYNVTEITGGLLSIGVQELDYQAQEDLFGKKRTVASEGVPESVRTNIDDQANAVGVGLCTPVLRSGVKKYRAVFFDKVQYSPPGFSAKTKEKTITFSHSTTSGKIMPNINGDMIDDATLDTVAEAEAWINTHLNIT